MKIPSLTSLNLDLPDIAESLSAIPSSPGIYLLESRGNHVHLSSTVNLHRRLNRLLALAYPATATVTHSLFADRLTGGQYLPTGSRLESALITYQITRKHFPSDYMKRLRLRLPWFVSLESKDHFPYLALGNRPTADGAASFGPFVTRDAAQAYEQSVSGLFQLRRCTELLHPWVGHPGCIYGEMSQCLRPCQTAVSTEEYRSEADKVASFLLGNGRRQISDLVLARDRAIEATEFEAAHVLHARLERLKSAAALRDDVIGNVRDFTGLAIVPGSEPKSVKLWPLLVGHWQDPICLKFSCHDNASKSLDSILKENVRKAFDCAMKDWNPFEALAIFSRWYYSSSRDGVWLSFRNPDDLSYRKLVRTISQFSKTKTAS